MKRLVLLALILTFLIKFILPSDLYTGDNALHIPFIKYFQSRGLFRNDYLFYLSNTNLQSRISIYYYVFAFISENINLPTTLQLNIFHALYLFFLYFVILVTTKRLNQSIFTGVVFCLIISLKFHIGGTAITSIESTLLPRGVGMVFGLWGLYFLSYRKFVISFILFFAGLLFHPLTIFYFILIIFIWFSNKKYSLIKITIFLLMMLVITSFFKNIPEAGLNVIKLRNPYAFVFLWNKQAWFNLILLLIPGIYYLVYKRSNDIYTRAVKISYFTALIFSIFNIIFLLIKPSALIITLQLGRLWFFAAAVSVFIMSRQISKYNKYNTEKIIFSIILVIFVILFNNRDPIVRQTTYLPDWINIQQWIKSNTGKNCLFLTPFYLTGFRIESERATTGEYKDGTLSFYSEIFADEWLKRLNAFRSGDILSDADLLKKLQHRYKFSFIVNYANIPTNYPILYKNNTFKLIDVNKNYKCD